MLDIHLVIFDGSPVNRQLGEWSNQFEHVGLATRIAPQPFCDLRLSLWRNQVCQWFLDSSPCEYLLMVDADMIPYAETQPILDRVLPIMGCGCIVQDGSQAHGGEVSCGCLRIRRDVLHQIERPWFDFTLKPSGLELAECECAHFTRKAEAAGFKPVVDGRMQHIIMAIATQLDGERYKLRPADMSTE